MTIHQKPIKHYLKIFILTLFAVPILGRGVSALCSEYLIKDARASDINHSSQCIGISPLRIEIPPLPKDEVFSCDVIIHRDGTYQVGLQYPYDHKEDAPKITSMLGGPITYRKVDGKITETIADMPGTISYAVYKDGQKIIGKDNIFPKVTSESFSKTGGIETQLALVNMRKGEKYTIHISGIPDHYRAYKGVYLIVKRRIFN